MTSSGGWSKSHHQHVEHQLRVFPKIVTKLEFPEVLIEMFPTDMDMRRADRPLEDRPIAFERIGVVNALAPLLGAMVDRAMLVARFGKLVVGRQFVRADGRALGDVFLNVRLKRIPLDVWHHAGHDVAATLQHPENDGLVFAHPTALAALAPAANHGFIDFDMTSKHRIAVNVGHVLADFMAHAPRGLVGHADLPLDFLRRYAVPRRGEQENGIEPFLQGSPALLKRRSDLRRNLMRAVGALVNGAFFDAAVTAVATTGRAIERLAIAEAHNMLKACVVVWKAFHEVVNGRGFEHLMSPNPFNIGSFIT